MRSDRLSNIGFPLLAPSFETRAAHAPPDEDIQKTRIAPEGASRCRALASGLTGPVGVVGVETLTDWGQT